MKLNIRKIIEKDWEFIPSWWEAYKSEGFPKDFLPDNGLGGFIVQKEKPIAAMWLWMTNSKTAIPAVVVSDRNYKDSDRSDALQLLMNYTTDYAEELGYKYAFGWGKPGVLLEKYREAGYHIDETPSYETILKF